MKRFLCLIGLSLLVACKTGETKAPLSPTAPIRPTATFAATTPTDTPQPQPTAASLPTNTALPTDHPVPVPAAPGQIVFYSERDGNAEIYTMNADGSQPQRLTDNAFEDSAPTWSPDGNQIAFISDRDDPAPLACFPNCLYQLYLIHADGSGEQRLVATDFPVLHPDWHPDGSRISFDSGTGLDGDIYIVNADGSGLQLLIEDGLWADWSPDGSQIAFVSNRDGNLELYLADADGGNQRRLTENPRMDIFPAWSPDGEWIAFMAGDGRSRQIYLISAQGGDERQITGQGRVTEDPAWSPDGSRIIFQSERDGNYEIYTLDVAQALQGNLDADLHRLTNHPAGDYWPDWNPCHPPE